MLHRVYLSMVTARLLTNCSNTPRNILIKTAEKITRTPAKRNEGYIFVAQSVVTKIPWSVGAPTPVLFSLQILHCGGHVSENPRSFLFHLHKDDK